MKFHSTHLFATLGLAVLLSGNAQAQATTGSLAGWDVLGDVISSNGAITLTTAFLDGAGDETYNLSGSSAVDAMEIAAAASEPIAALDLPAGNAATEGSLVSQTFAAAAGQTLSFDWSFTTHEDLYLDHAFVVIAGEFFTLATTAQPGAASQSFSHTFAQSGLVSLSFGVVDTLDYNGVSMLGVSNLQLAGTAPVPEPGTNALLLGGLVVVGFVAARRRGRAQAAA